MRKIALLTLILTALSVVGSVGFLRASSEQGHPFATTWCESPVVIPITADGVDGTVDLADGVTVARGAEARLGTSGPVVRLANTGSRTQIDFGQTLFHTQFLFAWVSTGDAIRVDAFNGNARQPIEASSVRGELRPAVDQPGTGLLAEAVDGFGGKGEIDLFSGVSEVLITNDGATPVDLIAAIGCPALHVETNTGSAPTWDATSQRFVAEHTVTFSNQLSTSRLRALRSADPQVANSVISDVGIDLISDIAGFSSVEIIDVDASRQLQLRANEAFDGTTDTSMLSLPIRLVDSTSHEFTFTIAYEPDFDDPIWLEGVDAPFPGITIRGMVDNVPVSATASIGETDSQRRLITPQPSLTVELDEREELRLANDGRIELSHRVTVTNSGETAVDQLSVAYPLGEMFGVGTVAESVSVLGTRGCTVAPQGRFDGVTSTVALFDLDGIRPGQDCTVSIKSRVIPGTQPESTGTRYEGQVTATARSGLREVTSTVPMTASVTQVAGIAAKIVDTEVTNLEDGSYRVEGSVRLSNVGDLDLAGGTVLFDVSRQGEPKSVFFSDFVGSDRCVAGSPPRSARSSVVVSGSVAVGTGVTCDMTFSFVAFPGAELTGWTFDVRAELPASAVQPALAAIAQESVDFVESPAVASATAIESIENNGDGTYSVRSTMTVTNQGNVPIVDVAVEDDSQDVFGDQVRAYQRLGDSCSAISARTPLPTDAVSPENNSCSVTLLSVIEPEADLTGAMFEFSAVASSLAGSQVSTTATTSQISFSEAPNLAADLIVESVERLDNQTLAVVLFGSLDNVGDVEARNVQLAVDLASSFEQPNVFDQSSVDVPFEVRYVTVRGLTRADAFDGVEQPNLLTGTETVGVGRAVDFRVLIHVTPGNQPGPYEFAVSASANSPATELFAPRSARDEITIPLVMLASESLESENNNDGTYSITHNLTVDNVGADTLPSVQVFTDFSDTFGRILLGVADVTSTCSSPVASGAQCTVTHRATVRPGAAVGPYNVSVNLAATDESGVSAFSLPAPERWSAPVPTQDIVLFNEEPSIDLEALVGDPHNNQDGTYDVTYFAEVTNTGDVPLYRVGLSNFVSETFGNRVRADEISGDACSAVSFANPLEPGLSCAQTRTVTIQPLADLGPWESSLAVTADSPSAAVLDGVVAFETVSFAESVAVDVDSRLVAGTNNGDGTYIPTWAGEFTNVGDVPLVEFTITNDPERYGGALSHSVTVEDSCSLLSPVNPLLPGATCRVERNDFIAPGAQLGPFDLDTQIAMTALSGETATASTTTNQITFVENPEVELSASVVSVESTEGSQLRVVQDLTLENSGDVRIGNLSASLDLEDLFGDLPYLVEGVVSNDFFISEAFTAGESSNILADGQSLAVGRSGTITLVLSIEPGLNTGPFTGDLRIEGTSPASAVVSSIITAQVDLPSVAVSVVAQAVENNRDGSYTVTSSYEVMNDGTTALEFVRLNEQLGTVYEGTNVALIRVEGEGIPAADLEDSRRGNLIDWGAGLASGESAIITSVVVVEPGNNLGPFNPVVRVEATSPAGTVVVADAASQDAIEFDEQPDLRVSQELVSRPTWDGERFSVTFAIDVVNNGDVELRGVQVRQDLLNALGADAQVAVTGIRSNTFVVNQNFDGRGQFPGTDPTTPTADVGDTRLLGGLDTLAAESSGSIELDLTITPETRGVFTPRVVVSARTPAGADLGTGDSRIEAGTLTRLSVQGELGVAKQVIGEPLLQADGTVAVTYEILVENSGPFPLDNVAVHDQLSQAFGIGSVFETSPVRIEPGSPCVGFASTSYDGGTVDPVLATGFALDPGARCRIQYDAVVEPAIALPGPYRSSAFAIATDPFSGTVIDDSTDGTNSDPDGNQEPGDNDIATAVVVQMIEPLVTVTAESISSSALNGSGRYELGFEITVENTGNIDVRPTRLLADLADQWDVRFDVLSIESDTLVVNEDFDGDRISNMIDGGAHIAAGDTSKVRFTVRTERPDQGELELVTEFRGISATGASVTSVASEPAIGDRPSGVLGESLFDTLSPEEARLLAIGSAAILLFVALFVRSAVRRFNSRQSTRAQPLDSGSGWTISAAALVEDNVLVDLREESAESSNEESLLDLRDGDHHRSRRRRGRAPQRSGDLS